MTLVLEDPPSGLDPKAHDDSPEPDRDLVDDGILDEGVFDEDDEMFDEDEQNESLVRAFTLTGGRTQNKEVAVPIQSVVCQSQASLAAPPTLAPVESEIWRVAGDRLSSAEISYRLELPLGVVRVLVGDLVTAGLVTVGKTTATGNAQLVRRLIDGVRSL